MLGAQSFILLSLNRTQKGQQCHNSGTVLASVHMPDTIQPIHGFSFQSFRFPYQSRPQSTQWKIPVEYQEIFLQEEETVFPLCLWQGAALTVCFTFSY